MRRAQLARGSFLIVEARFDSRFDPALRRPVKIALHDSRCRLEPASEPLAQRAGRWIVEFWSPGIPESFSATPLLIGYE